MQFTTVTRIYSDDPSWSADLVTPNFGKERKSMSDWNSTPDEPAYGVPETVDYTKLSGTDSFVEEGSDCHDGPGFDNENELPESDYPEVGVGDV
jgi:hypothetical protein